ncbi:KxYKxGKxW signal peptide domain-containing protein [Fructobacillus tropaeoli]|uniref:Serine-rich repeat adhesion glycoprotein n=1 Tax=Fructobacillus tropaeoli TaxID=709323 RepID=A0A3F3H1I5_9LACO|nr:KxYKxGKxW signal peptide domain-containing protein [Fructobacillus tropaeoli]GAP04454.1 serine-rich repeat adhesion glycoprotein [Fructobacillus tropaeoli]
MNRNQDLNKTIKEHFKMYKAGKVWLVAGITLSFLSLGSGSLAAHADSIAKSGESSQTDGGSQLTATNSAATSTASVTSQQTAQVSQTAFIATSLSVSQSQSTSTSSSTSQSQLNSESVSTSQSQSTSASASTSQSQSISASASTSQSQSSVAGSTTNQSQSLSASVSASQSLALLHSGQGQANTQFITSQSTQTTAQAGTTDENVSALSLGTTAVTPEALAQSDLADQGTVLGDSSDSSTTSQSSIGSQTSTSPAPTAVQSMADDQTARSQFNSTVASNTTSQSNQANPSSITISQSDQLTNIAQYKAQDQANNSYAAVTDWASFKAAYLNDNIRFIDIQNDITNPNAGNYNDLSERTQNIIIQGNGHQLNLGQAAMWTGVSPNVASNGTGGSTFTITNTNLVQYDAWNSTGESGSIGKGGYPNAAISSYSQNNSDGGWIYNIDNVSLNGPQGITGPANQQPEHLLDAEGSYAIFSGNVTVNSTQEMARISKVDIVNGANVNFQLANGANVTSNTGDGSPMFNFSSLATAQSQGSAITGSDHMFRVGDGASVSGGFYHSGAAAPGLFNYGLVYGSYQGMEIGDNVTWTLDGYRHLLDQLNYNGSNPNNRQYIFGRNFTVNILNNQDNLSGVTAFDGRDCI